MARKKARARAAEQTPVVDSTIILGDLTDVTQITRAGNVVTLHGHHTNRSVALPNESVAAQFWQALAYEASMAVADEKQFFCVSFGADEDELGEEYYDGSTLH